MSLTLDRVKASPYGDPARYEAEMRAAMDEILPDDWPVAKYSDDQPRDDSGKWTDGGSGDPRAMADWGRWTKATSSTEKAALGRYQAGGSGAINLALRGKPVASEEKGPLHGMQIGTAVKRMDAAIAKADPLPREAVTYRAIATYNEDPTGRLLDLKPGTRFRDGGFVSTSASADWVRRRYAPPDQGGDTSGNGPDHWQMMEIHVPKGTRVAFLAAEGATDVGSFKHEQEVLLPRGGTFTVRSVKGPLSVLDYEPPVAP